MEIHPTSPRKSRETRIVWSSRNRRRRFSDCLVVRLSRRARQSLTTWLPRWAPQVQKPLSPAALLKTLSAVILGQHVTEFGGY